MSDVLIIKLVDGSEILAEVEDKGASLVLKNPTNIAAGHNPQTGAVDVHMAPLLPLGASKEIEIPRTSVVFSYEPVSDIKNKFNSMFGKIITTERGLIKP